MFIVAIDTQVAVDTHFFSSLHHGVGVDIKIELYVKHYCVIYSTGASRVSR